MINRIQSAVRQGLAELDRALLIVLVVAVSAAPVLFLNQTADAAQVTSRSLLITSAQAGATASYTPSFVPGTTAAIQGLKFQACTTALGTCTAPAGLSFSSAAGGTRTGTWTNATDFT